MRLKSFPLFVIKVNNNMINYLLLPKISITHIGMLHFYKEEGQMVFLLIDNCINISTSYCIYNHSYTFFYYSATAIPIITNWIKKTRVPNIIVSIYFCYKNIVTKDIVDINYNMGGFRDGIKK